MERRLRLRKEWEVNLARSRGKAYADGPIVVRVRPNELDPPQNRYAVIAGRKVGKAHERNRCKRLVREALRHRHPHLRPGHDLVVIVRGGVRELTGLAVAEASLDRIIARAKLGNPSAVAASDAVTRGQPTESEPAPTPPSSSAKPEPGQVVTPSTERATPDETAEPSAPLISADDLRTNHS